VPGDARADRRAALLGSLDGEQLDGLIVAHLPNVRYLTGFTGTAGVAAVLRQETVLVTDFRYRTQAEVEVETAARIEIASSDAWARLFEVLEEYPGLDTVGFEGHAVTVADARRFADAQGHVRFRPAAELVERLRACKDEDEVRAIREAARLCLEALEATLACVRPGRTERDVAAQLEHELRRRGSEWHPFPTIAASGPRSALPHARTGGRELGVGDWLLLDFGAQLDGYCADITRTVVVGRPADERQRAVYELVREAQRTALRSVRAGMTGREADAVARSLIERRGFGDAFGHSRGHGLGLEVHEAPRVSRTNTEVLPPGAVVTIEPGLYFPGWGGVRIEDDVRLTTEGTELLSDGGTELREVGW
jgi:Xaa-Pro aminopeptidase